MVRLLSELDRLIEEGLSLFARGDLDGALAQWEHALQLDPANAQAHSYVEYVRSNYELLTSEAPSGESAPFAIVDDEDEYEVEVFRGEVQPAEAALRVVEATEEGWVIEDDAAAARIEEPSAPPAPELALEPEPALALAPEPALALASDPALALASEPALALAPEPAPAPEPLDPSESSESLTLELEVDEPAAVAAPVAPTADQAPGTFALHPSDASDGISFDDLTREYPGGPARPPSELLGATEPSESAEFRADVTPTPGFGPEPTPGFVAEVTPGFGTPGDFQTPTGFGTQVTDIRKRELGFVQPVDRTSDRAVERPIEAPVEPPAELKLTLRAPDSQPLVLPLAAPPDDAPRGAGEAEIELTYDDPDPEPRPELDLEPKTTERAPVSAAELAAARPAAEDLIASLPSPRPAPRVGPTTRDLPGATRRPAAPSEPPSPAAPTRDFRSIELPLPGIHTRDFDAVTLEKPSRAALVPPPDLSDATPTRDLPTLKQQKITRPAAPTADVPLISAPTLDLGLRPRRAPTEDEPTAQADLRDLRPAGARGDAEPVHADPADPIDPIDPIDARSIEILDEIDAGSPAEEPREDRIRRRISTLFERAAEWCRAGELERAVLAVDLALSEDPASALAQKLIHRNRETMSVVFQAFLGDLDRQPVLARPLHELAAAPISPRAAFLLSRIDGTLSLDEILDVSGMPRLEAYRYLCQLFLRGILH